MGLLFSASQAVIIGLAPGCTCWKKDLTGKNENSWNLTKQRETTGDSCKNGRRLLRRLFDRNREIFRDFNFRGFILTAKYRENWKTAKISAYTVYFPIKVAAIDGKQIANMSYHAGVETLLTIGYSKLGRKLLRRPAPKVGFNMGDIAMLSIDILLAMATQDMLIKQGIIPADIMK